MKTEATFLTTITKVISMIPAAVLSLLLPVIPLIIGVGIAIFTDTIFGIWAVKSTEPEKFKSSILRKGFVTKLFFYQAVVLSIFFIDKLIIGELIALINPIQFLATKLVALALIMIEAVSIDEKFKIVHNKSIVQGIKDFINSYNTIKKDIN